VLKNNPKGFTADVTSFTTAQPRLSEKCWVGVGFKHSIYKIRKPSLVLVWVCFFGGGEGVGFLV